MGRGNESLFAASGSHDQDGRQAHIYPTKKETHTVVFSNFLGNNKTFSYFIQTDL